MTGELLTKEQRVQSVCLGLFSLALDWWSLGVFAAGKKMGIKVIAQGLLVDAAQSIVFGYSGKFVMEKLTSSGFTPLQAFVINLFGTILLVGMMKRLVRDVGGVGGDFLSGMSPEDQEKYLRWNEQVEAGISLNDRVKINNWNYVPEIDYYLKNKDVLDNWEFFDQLTGEAIYPPNHGFLYGQYDEGPLKIGEIIDRYGSDSGNYYSPAGTSYEARSLPPFMENAKYTKYEVVVPFAVESGYTHPWFGQTEIGIQYYTDYTVDELLNDLGWIKELK